MPRKKVHRKPITGVFFAAVLLIASFPAVVPAESTESKETPWERFHFELCKAILIRSI
jgi:hypothetical protein